MKKKTTNRILSGVITVAAIAVLIILAVYRSGNTGKSQLQSENNKPSVISNYSADSPVVQETDKSKKTTDKSLVTTDSSIPDKKDSLRRDVFSYSLEVADELAKRTDITELKTLAKYLRNNLTLSKPSAPDKLAPIDSVRGDFVGFVAILDNDTLPNTKHWNTAAAKPGINFAPNGNLICITSNLETWYSREIWAMMLIHEAVKAKLYKPEKFTKTYLQDYDSELELKAHDLSNKVLLFLGGDRYRELLNIEKNRLDSEAVKKTELVVNTYENVLGVYYSSRVSYDELSDIFSLTTKLEKDYIGKHFWIHAMCSLIDEKLGVQSNERKLSFMQSVYHSN